MNLANAGIATKFFIENLIFVLPLAIFFLWKKKSFKRTSVLLTGLCDSGKTILFSQLLYGELRETFTSIVENADDYTNDENGKTVGVIDIPGNERLRGRFFDQYKNTAKAIVYVIDSVTVQKDIRDVAEWVLTDAVTMGRKAHSFTNWFFSHLSYLYTILADEATASIPILIVCNKQDETLAKGSSVIKSLLEKELWVAELEYAVCAEFVIIFVTLN